MSSVGLGTPFETRALSHSSQRTAQGNVILFHVLKCSLRDYWIPKPAHHFNPVDAKESFQVGLSFKVARGFFFLGGVVVM